MEVAINKSESLKLTRTRDFMTYATYVALTLISDISYAVVSPGMSDSVATLANHLVKDLRVKQKT